MTLIAACQQVQQQGKKDGQDAEPQPLPDLDRAPSSAEVRVVRDLLEREVADAIEVACQQRREDGETPLA
jgi:hypothetical protein